MRSKLKILFFLFSSLSFGQYTYLIELNDRNSAPIFTKHMESLVYNGSNPDEEDFFHLRNVTSFYQSFPHAKRDKNLNNFTLVTTDANLMEDMITAFPSKYLHYDDITDMQAELLNSYPNDYGTTSPVTNLGATLNFSNYDYTHVPKAWDITYGDKDIKIGISDSFINTTDHDFGDKASLLTPYSTGYDLTLEGYHGTTTAGLAAAQANNAHGIAGVCGNCSVVGAQYGNYDNLFLLAEAGARIINMSWSDISTTNPNVTTYQSVIDELYEDYNVMLVASAGNNTSYAEAYAANNYMLYNYPASYNHVICVTSVNHKNNYGDTEVYVPNWGNVSQGVKDMISFSVVTNYQGNGPYAFYNSSNTTNDKVDICAPGYLIPIYPRYQLGYVNPVTGLPDYYGSGTSNAAPQVSGAFGLMFSLNRCLLNDEAEDVLQLTSKNLEIIPRNVMFIGRSGAGGMEVGDAVEFVHEMMIPTGNALIDGQDFHRFSFDLKHIANKLTISNQVLRDNNISDFTAKNGIEVLVNSDFRPNENGYVDLKTDSNLEVCSLENSAKQNNRTPKKEKLPNAKAVKLFPNPNNGIFTIALSQKDMKTSDYVIVDILGKTIHSGKGNGHDLNIDVTHIPAGMYFIKVSSESYAETFKFIKK